MADVEFSRGGARRPGPVVEDPFLQWASGLQTMNRQIYAGWLVEVGKDSDLDDAMRAADFQQITIKHGSGSTVTHWAVETVNAYVIADGVQTIGEMKRTRDRYGIAFAWGQRDDGKPVSKLRARVLLRELLMVGYAEPLTLTLRGTVTGDLIDGLMRQYDVLEQINAFRRLAQKPAIDLPFYAASIPIGPGAEVRRGSGNATKEITPPSVAIPTPITQEYVKAHWIKRDWIAAIEARMDDTLRWSVETSAQLAAGNEAQAHEHESLL